MWIQLINRQNIVSIFFIKDLLHFSPTSDHFRQNETNCVFIQFASCCDAIMKHQSLIIYFGPSIREFTILIWLNNQSKQALHKSALQLYLLFFGFVSIIQTILCMHRLKNSIPYVKYNNVDQLFI